MYAEPSNSETTRPESFKSATENAETPSPDPVNPKHNNSDSINPEPVVSESAKLETIKTRPVNPEPANDQHVNPEFLNTESISREPADDDEPARPADGPTTTQSAEAAEVPQNTMAPIQVDDLSV